MGSPDGEGVGTSWTWILLALSLQYDREDTFRPLGDPACYGRPLAKS